MMLLFYFCMQFILKNNNHSLSALKIYRYGFILTTLLIGVWSKLYATDWAQPTSPIWPIPQIATIESDSKELQLIDLGRRLFSDKGLSGDGSVSCQECHRPEYAGANRQKRAVRPGAIVPIRNVPSIYNLRYIYRYQWDGRFSQLEDAITFSLESSNQMGNSMENIMRYLDENKEYKLAFLSAFGDNLDSNQIVVALKAYLWTLNTPNSRFDRYLRGDYRAISRIEREGLRLFIDYGCSSCHNGIGIGANSMQQHGVFGYHVDKVGAITDKGRYLITMDQDDIDRFRVPSLRNVAETAPYMHNGKMDNLFSAVEMMARHQLGIKLKSEDIKTIEAFLRTLSAPLEKGAVTGE